MPGIHLKPAEIPRGSRLQLSPRADQLLFLVSRFMWPANMLALAVVVGRVYGDAGMASYTYALALCAPFYFLTSLNFGLFIAVHGTHSQRPRELLVLRLATAALSVPVLWIAARWAAPTLVAVTLALWVSRLAEMLLDPVAAHIASRGEDSGPSRGASLFVMELARLATFQGALGLMVVLSPSPLPVLLLVSGGTALVFCAVVLISSPMWRPAGISWESLGPQARELLRHCTPLTLSGAMLALLISAPRLANESSMSDPERAAFGLAQILVGAVAVFFNSIWLYELPRFKSLALDGAREALHRRVLALSSGFFLATVGIALGLGAAQASLFTMFNISPESSGLFPLLFGVLALQHCISIVRDQLKLAGRYWTEVRVLALAACAALAAYAGVIAMHGSWFTSVLAMCVASAGVQVMVVQLLSRGRRA